ncbi:hypothetical protein [Sphingomonas nostoxanthinifaciens]|uniref:hypothetical protein n=1 Tax=Sphingomonas nostoxanthinifaciens TaxID=2872652 RepID=UPI001CC1C594|nr:hypothetical protein [Sphingomonas nostoxanthinifaciens]UAK25190.1 hypothetical protein K8P63_03025 [Sphingomonas nostoxanthinifaciens]
MESEVGTLLNEVGNVLAQDADYPLDGTFLYVEADWGWVDMMIFKDLGDHLLARWPMNGLADVLAELWEAEVPAKRWSSMQYRIEGGAFSASFTHGQLDPEESTLDRRHRILQQRYGNKRVDYPPLRRRGPDA